MDDEIKKAEDEYEKYKLELGEDHRETLALFCSIAKEFYKKGDYDRALPLYEECLAKRKRFLGDDHRDTLISLNILAGLFYNNGDYYRALSLYNECLEGWKRVFGEDNPNTRRLRNTIDELKQHMKESDKFPPAAGGGRNKKRYFRKSKKSKLTKCSRNVRRSRNRKGGMTNSQIKDEIKTLIKLDKTNQIDELAYTINFKKIFGYWQSLQTPQRKKEFADSFVEVASYKPFVNHDTRIPIYNRIIADLKKTEEGIENGTIILQGYLRPPSVVERENKDMAERHLDELGGIGSNASGGKSRRRRRHNRRSSKKHKKARKSRRANRRHSRKH
jgi:tetratricopeptide (TPR) repeat protein